jgi:hypothetical protein
LATTVTVQVTPPGRFALGCRTNEEAGDAVVTVNAFGVPTGHASVNAVPVTFTDSLKFTVIVVLGRIVVAPFAGTVLLTVGSVFTVNVCSP